MDFASIFISLLSRFDQWLRSRLSGKHWAVKVTFFALILSLFMASPAFDFSSNAPLTKRAMAVEAQIANLVEFWETNEPTNAMFRITVPLIARVLHLDLKGTLVLQFITGVLLFYVLAKLVERETSDRMMAFYLTALVAVTYPGTAAFLETRYYFDSFAYLFLVCAMWFQAPPVISLSCLLAFFTDERALIASGFVFLWWVIKSSDDVLFRKRWLNSRSLTVALTLFLYIIIRQTLANRFQIQTWSESRLEFLLFEQLNNSISGIWSGLEAGWLLVGLALIALAIKRQWFLLSSIIIVITVQVVAALSVVDITRSMGYLLPCLLLAVLILWKVQEKNLLKWIEISAFVSLIAINYGVGGKSSIWMFYPLPVQILRLILGT